MTLESGSGAGAHYPDTRCGCGAIWIAQGFHALRDMGGTLHRRGSPCFRETDAPAAFASRGRAEGPPDLTDLQSRLEQAELERDCYLAQRDTANEQMRRLMDESESALAEARHKALEEAAGLCDAAAQANIGGESMDEGWHAKMWAALTRQAERLSDAIRALASGTAAPPPQDSPILSSCSPDCTTGPEGGVLHSVEHQYRLAGGSIKTCPVCGEERHGGTCADAALASGNAPEKDQEKGAAAPHSYPCHCGARLIGATKWIGDGHGPWVCVSGAAAPRFQKIVRAVARLTSFRVGRDGHKLRRKLYLAPIGQPREEYRARWLRDALGKVFEPGDEVAIVPAAAVRQGNAGDSPPTNAVLTLDRSLEEK